MNNEAAISRSGVIANWQAAFRAQPKIWGTRYSLSGEGWEDSGNFYDTKEAAEEELKFAKRNGRHCEIFSQNIHNRELSKQRWAGFQPTISHD